MSKKMGFILRFSLTLALLLCIGTAFMAAGTSTASGNGLGTVNLTVNASLSSDAVQTSITVQKNSQFTLYYWVSPQGSPAQGVENVDGCVNFVNTYLEADQLTYDNYENVQPATGTLFSNAAWRNMSNTTGIADFSDGIPGGALAKTTVFPMYFIIFNAKAITPASGTNVTINDSGDRISAAWFNVNNVPQDVTGVRSGITVKVETTPEVNFTPASGTSVAGQGVPFTSSCASGTGPVETHKWEYSKDGGAFTQFSTDANPTWTPTATGTYSIRYTGTNTLPTGNNDVETKTNAFVVTPAPAHHFKITGSATMTTGGTNALTVNTYDEYDNLCSSGANDYDGIKSLVFSGLADAPDGNHPTVANNAAADIDFGTGTNLTFAHGVASSNVNLKAYKAQSSTVHGTAGTVSSDPLVKAGGVGLALTVNTGPVNKLVYTTQPASTGTVDAPFTTQPVLEIRDAYGNLCTTANNSLTLSAVLSGAHGTPGTGIMTGTATMTPTNGVYDFNNASPKVGYTKTDSIHILATSGAMTVYSTTPIVMNVGATHHLKLTGSATMNAGGTNAVTVNAYDQYDNATPAYVGDKNLVYSGLDASLSGNNPTVTDKDTNAVNFGTITPTTFASGSATANLKAYKAQSGTVNVLVDGSSPAIGSAGNASWGLALQVNSLAATSLRIAGTATIGAGSNNALTITACDLYGNTDPTYTGSRNLTFNGLADAPDGNKATVSSNTGAAVNLGDTTAITFSNGVSTTTGGGGTLKAYKAGGGTLNVSDGTIGSVTGSYGLALTVNPGTAASLRITGTGTVTAGVANQLTIRACDAYGNVDTAYNYPSGKNLTFSGVAASPAPSSTAPTVTKNDGSPVAVGSLTLINFTSGVSVPDSGACVSKAYNAATGTLNVTDGTIGSATGSFGLALTVNPDVLHHVTVTPSCPTVVMNSNQQFNAAAMDQYSNTITGPAFTWSVVVVAHGTAGTINSSGLFTAGVTPGECSDFVNVIKAAVTGNETIYGTTSVKVQGATVTVTAKLQGGLRPIPVGGDFKGYNVPLTLKAFPSTTVLNSANILTESASYTLSTSGTPPAITITNVNTTTRVITFTAVGLPVGTFNLTLSTTHCLVNLYNGCIIAASGTTLDLGELLEGNADDYITPITNNQTQIFGSDFNMLLNDYLQQSTGDKWNDGRCDFDRNGQVTSIDFSLLSDNYTLTSPRDVTPAP